MTHRIDISGFEETPDRTRCESIRSALGSFIDGELSRPEASEVHEHLTDCAICRHALREEESLVELVLDQLVSVAPPSQVNQSHWASVAIESSQPATNSVPSRAASNATRPRIPGAKILGGWNSVLAAAAIVLVALLMPPVNSDRSFDATQAGNSPSIAMSDPARASADPESSGAPSTSERPPFVADAFPFEHVSEEDSTFVSLSGNPIEDESPVLSSIQVELAAGDLDGDGHLTIADLGLLARLVDLQTSSLRTSEINAEWRRIANVCPAAGDLDGDGSLTPSDYSTATKMWISDTEAPSILYRANSLLACSIVCP